MSDDIERFANGEAGFASFRDPAWHRLGKTFQEVLPTERVLAEANMAAWNVRLIPTVSMVEGKMVEVAEKFTVVRDNPVTMGQIDGLGVVGKKYRAVQNEQVFEFGDAILAANPEAHWDTAGSIRNGRVVFGCIKLPSDTKIGGVDQVDMYLMVMSSHDGSTGVVVALTPVRIVCANTLRAGLRNATHTFKARHTESVTGRIEDARKALALSTDYFEQFINTAEQLADIDVSDAQLDELIESVWKKPVDKSDDGERRTGLTRWENKVEQVHKVWNGEADLSGLDTIGEIKGTAWGAVNALTETVDRYGRSTGKFERMAGFNPHAEDEKTKIFHIATNLWLPQPELVTA